MSEPEISYAVINTHEQRIAGSVIASLIHENAVLSAFVEQLKAQLAGQPPSAETR